MKPENHVELQSSGLICDNPQCDWEDRTVAFENLKEWLNKPCPKCGENLLTEQDFKNAQHIRLSMALINSLNEEQIEAIANLVDKEEAMKSNFLKDAKGLEFLSGEGLVSVTIDSHIEPRITEIKPVDDSNPTARN